MLFELTTTRLVMLDKIHANSEKQCKPLNNS